MVAVAMGGVEETRYLLGIKFLKQEMIKYIPIFYIFMLIYTHLLNLGDLVLTGSPAGVSRVLPGDILKVCHPSGFFESNASI